MQNTLITNIRTLNICWHSSISIAYYMYNIKIATLLTLTYYPKFNRRTTLCSFVMKKVEKGWQISSAEFVTEFKPKHTHRYTCTLLLTSTYCTPRNSTASLYLSLNGTLHQGTCILEASSPERRSSTCIIKSTITFTTDECSLMASTEPLPRRANTTQEDCKVKSHSSCPVPWEWLRASPHPTSGGRMIQGPHPLPNKVPC